MKKKTAKKIPGKKKTQARPAAKKTAPAKKKVAAKKAAPARKSAAKKPAPVAAPPKPVTAAKPAPRPTPKPVVAPPPRAMPAPTPPRPASTGTITADEVVLGHVMALRPRIHVGFKPSAFGDAKRALVDERYATIEEAARAVAEKAIEISNESSRQDPFSRR